MSKEESELERLIDKVDKSFDSTIGKLIRIRVSLSRIGLIAVAFLTFLLAYYFTQIAVQAANANLLELSVSIDATAAAIFGLGLSMSTMVLSRDWAESEKREAESLFFKRLNCSANTISLRALIRMRVALPKGVSLKPASDANSELFTEKEFARRLLE